MNAIKGLAKVLLLLSLVTGASNGVQLSDVLRYLLTYTYTL